MPVSPGRPKGVPNKATALLKDAILIAAERAGEGDLAAYLHAQAIANPGPFMALLGKVLPMQVTGSIATDITHHGTLGISDTARFIADALGKREDATPGQPRPH